MPGSQDDVLSQFICSEGLTESYRSGYHTFLNLLSEQARLANNEVVVKLQEGQGLPVF